MKQAQQEYDHLHKLLAERTNECLAEIKAHLLKPQADGEDISKQAAILEGKELSSAPKGASD
jgi:hypothetical protein